METSNNTNVFVSKYTIEQNKIRDEYYSTNIYLGQDFKDYCKVRYTLHKDSHKNQGLLLMIYAYEWFKYKSNRKKFLYHPYLKVEDFNKYTTIEKEANFKFKSSCLLSYLLIGVFIAFRKSKNPDITMSKFFSKVKFLLLSSFSTGILYYYKCKYLDSITEKQFNNYMKLDVDREQLKSMIKKQGGLIDQEYI